MSCRHFLSSLRTSTSHLHRGYCTQTLMNSKVRAKRSELFGREKARQMAHVSRIEKIQVKHVGPPEDCTLLMNRSLSTPFNCAMHISELLMKRSVIALVNGQPWDMHRPLVEDCELQFVHFKDERPEAVNQAFWRSCSFILGYVLEHAFKDEHYVELCSFPRPNIRSGSFIYDVDLNLPDWKPSQAELNCISRIGGQLQYEDLKFDRLEVDASLALRMFENNRFKKAQIPSIAAQSSDGNTVCVYQLGDHVDISRGPLISSTSLLSRFHVTAVHDIDSSEFGPLQRVQGMATPQQLPVHFWTFDFLSERAARLNDAPVPTLNEPAGQVTQTTT